MIPKKIHYCWFGKGKKPRLAQKCIASWKKFCPDYEIIEWNEDNFDIHMNGYTEMCYQNKKWAFLSDYVRLVVINQNGGIYFDTDVELLRSVDALLNTEAYIGFETNEYVNTGMGFGSVAHGIMVEEMLSQYNSLLDGQNGIVGCPILNTRALETLGLQKNGKLQILNGATIYPIDFFNPYDASTGRLRKTKNTVSIHWYFASWMKRSFRIRAKFTKPLHRIQEILRR